MSRIKAVIFDLDGTLIDTREIIFQAYQHAMRENGHPEPSRQQISDLVGTKLEDAYKILAPGNSQPILVKSHRKFTADNINLVRRFDKITETVEAVKSRGIKVAIWTGRGNHTIEMLRMCGIDPEMFLSIVQAGDYDKPKPDPEGLLLTLEKIHSKAAESIMVGDARLDIIAAKRAEVLAAVGVSYGFASREELEKAGAEYILDSLDDFMELIDKIEQYHSS